MLLNQCSAIHVFHCNYDFIVNPAHQHQFNYTWLDWGGFFEVVLKVSVEGIGTEIYSDIIVLDTPPKSIWIYKMAE